MSYNVDTWKTQSVVNLRIPMAAFFVHPRTDWHPAFIAGPDGRQSIDNFEFTLSGRVENDVICVDEINIHGEGSGTFIYWILEPALRQSAGELVASCVWEGGESINRLIVKDGDVDWVDIEV